MSCNLYEIKDLVFRYPSVKGTEPVLQISDLMIRKNEVTVIRGHNGSGKSTLLKLLNGLLEQEKGQILSDNLRSVLVQQEPYLFHGSVSHNLASPLRFAGLKIRDFSELIKENLALVGLSGFEKRRASELSGGEKKRVALARALMTRPQVLLLDEPDANVDTQTSRKMETLIRSLPPRGISVVLCSHHKGFAYRTCDTIIDLHQGVPVDPGLNIFRGSYRFRAHIHSEFVTGDSSILCPSRHGSYNTAVILPESISIASGPVTADDQNHYRCTVEAVKRYNDGSVILKFSGPLLCTVRLNPADYSRTPLKKGDKANLVFNPSSVKLY